MFTDTAVFIHLHKTHTLIIPYMHTHTHIYTFSLLVLIENFCHGEGHFVDLVVFGLLAHVSPGQI